MNRIPTEGLKRLIYAPRRVAGWGLNEQNPDRGIETYSSAIHDCPTKSSLNEQNPDRGIETQIALNIFPILMPLE